MKCDGMFLQSGDLSYKENLQLHIIHTQRLELDLKFKPFHSVFPHRLGKSKFFVFPPSNFFNGRCGVCCSLKVFICSAYLMCRHLLAPPPPPQNMHWHSIVSFHTSAFFLTWLAIFTLTDTCSSTETHDILNRWIMLLCNFDNTLNSLMSAHLCPCLLLP
jgi:hypothetical protein